MSIEENKAIIRSYMEEAFNKGNLAVVPEVIAPEFVYHTLLGEIKGTDGVKQLVTTMRNAFPDIKYTIDNIVVEGNVGAFNMRVQGTFKGEILGMSPTGKQFDVAEAVFMRFAGGKAVEGWVYGDSSTISQQLGITPPTQ